MLSEVGQVRDGERKALVEKTKALVETILAVAYRPSRFGMGGYGSAQVRSDESSLKEKDSSPIFSVLLRRIIAPQGRSRKLSRTSRVVVEEGFKFSKDGFRLGIRR